MMVAAVLAMPVFAVIWAPNVWVAASLLGLTLAAHQMFSTSIFGLATDVFPARMTGLVIGLAATLAGFSGLAMNEYTGWVRVNGGDWAPMLALCAFAKLVAVIVVHALVPNIDASREQDDRCGGGVTGSREKRGWPIPPALVAWIAVAVAILVGVTWATSAGLLTWSMAVDAREAAQGFVARYAIVAYAGYVALFVIDGAGAFPGAALDHRLRRHGVRLLAGADRCRGRRRC